MAAFTFPQPSNIAVTSSTRSVLSVFNILDRSFSRKFTDRFGNQNFASLLQMLGKERKVDNRDFYHHESYGKLHAAVQVSAVTGSGAGLTSSVTIQAGSTYNGGTQSPLRVGEVVTISASGIEGKILTVPTVTTCTIAPLKSSATFNPAVNDWLLFKGISEAGEASSKKNSLVNQTTKFTFSTTEIRDDYAVSDRAMVEKIEFDFNGHPYLWYKDWDDMQRRFDNNREFKLIQGDILNNANASATSVGAQGLISQMTANAGSLTYTPGSFSVATDFHAINREIRFNGGPSKYNWLMDIYSFQEVQDKLFAAYPGGAIVWGNASGSDNDIKALYGFQGIKIDGVTHMLKVYDPFSPETTHGVRPAATPVYRNYALILPDGSTPDPVNGETRFSVALAYQETGGQKVFTWETGALAAGGATDDVLEKRIHITTKCGIEGYALNQGIILDGA